MKVLGLVLLALATASAAPATTRSPGEPDDCSKECLNGVIQYGQELSILKHPDLSNYFNKLDEVCEVISTARKCLERCGASSNPFALESLNLVCQPKTQEKIDSIKQCLHYVDSNINEVCSKECSKEHIIDETDVKMSNPMIQKANGDCANFKCMARCNVEVVASQCGKGLGKEFQGLLQEVVDAQRKDLENLKLVEAMAKSSPPECNYLYDSTVLFGGKQQQQSSEEILTSADPKEDAKALLAQAQLQLLVKQIELADKQDHLIDRENAKIDMEMAYMAHKAEMKEMKFHAQHSLPTFVPMEKEPKMPISMEPISHPEQQEMPSHSEQQPLPEEEHAQPEEPQHPEQMQSEPHPEEAHSQPEEPAHPEHPPMEAHPEMPPMEAHPPMPMEQQQPMPPMDFPHPEAMPMEMPRKHKMPKFGPIMINGVPMEFIPLGEIPPPQMEMPMQFPMEAAAMPRFL
jgi:hypothetical protein